MIHQLRKFDLGIYVVVTSVHPLRVYYYDTDVLLRFCREDYEPFDPLNENKYVVGDDYLPAWQVHTRVGNLVHDAAPTKCAHAKAVNDYSYRLRHLVSTTLTWALTSVRPWMHI